MLHTVSYGIGYIIKNLTDFRIALYRIISYHKKPIENVIINHIHCLWETMMTNSVTRWSWS